MDEDLNGIVDFDFFDESMSSNVGELDYLPVLGKPPIKTKDVGKDKLNERRFEIDSVSNNNANDQSYLTDYSAYHESGNCGSKTIDFEYEDANKVKKHDEFAVPWLDSNSCEGDHRSDTSKLTKCTNISNNNMNLSFLKDIETKRISHNSYVDDFDSDRDCTTKGKHTINIPTSGRSENNDEIDIRNRTYSVSSSSSAYSQSDQSDTNEQTITIAKHTKRNVTFSNDKVIRSQSGRKSRLSLNKASRKDKKTEPKQSSKVKTSATKTKTRNCRRSSDTSSEITDVSPLSSAESSPRSECHDSNKKHIGYIDYQKAKIGSLKSDKTTNNIHKTNSKQNSMEFKLLMQAIQELDNGRGEQVKCKKHQSNFDKVLNSNNDRNFSFTHQRCKMIEQENKRLMQQLSKNRSKERSQSAGFVQRRLPSSALNRYREQKKIECANFDFLKRLGNIRPTKGLTRNEQFTEYNRYTQYGAIQRKQLTHTTPSQASFVSDEVSVDSGPTSSIVSSSSIASRPSSGQQSSNGLSSHTSSYGKHSKSRPAWDSRW